MTIILKSFALFASKQLVEYSEMSSNTSFLVVLSWPNNLHLNPPRDLFIVLSYVDHHFALPAVEITKLHKYDLISEKNNSVTDSALSCFLNFVKEGDVTGGNERLREH